MGVNHVLGPYPKIFNKQGTLEDYSMKNVDFLFLNAIVLTMDEEYNLFRKGAVAVDGDKIIAVGTSESLLKEYSSSTIVDCEEKVLMPGLVNAHTHVPMTLLRGLADDLRLDVWLMGYMMPVEREFVSTDFVTLGTSIACAEMIRSGVTSFADMYYFEEDVARATSAAGMRAVCSQTVMKFPTPDAGSFEESLEYSRDFIKRWVNHPLIVPSVAPHAPYTCTPEILKATAQLAMEFDVPLHTHLSETNLEVENMRNEHGMPVIPYVKKQGLFEAKVLAAHCVHVDEGEMRTMLHAGAGVAHNPSSNLKLASGVAPIKKMLDIGLNVGIGTDGPASNNDLDMFEEIRLAALLAKGFGNDPTVMPAKTILTMATRIGAKALHIGSITGSIEPGKKADLILLDVSPVHNSPKFERDQNGIYAQIIYASKANDVTDVMVNGKFLMRNKQLLTLNEKDLLVSAQEYAKKIDSFLFIREKSVLSKLIAIGGALEQESFEVQLKVTIDDPKTVEDALKNPTIEIVRKRHYHEYDSYFLFADEENNRLRYREDDFINAAGNVESVRYRLTLIGPSTDNQKASDILLSRSQYFAPAGQSLRFYREYFKPSSEYEIEKDRLRYLVKFQDTEFFINIDTIIKPDLGIYLEIKSRTWSRLDAELKSKKVSQLLSLLVQKPGRVVTQDYFELLRHQK
jgi:5-methylthioadenosine/S-adenosylhomocysteine deaminase